MNPAFDTYIQSLAGRDVTIIGAGVSNSRLIRMLCSAGARVTVRDRNPALPREEWDDLGIGFRTRASKLLTNDHVASLIEKLLVL